MRCSIRLEVPLWDPDEARLSSANSSANPLSSSSQSASDSAASALPSASSLDPTVSALASSSSLPSSLSPSSSALAPPPSAKLLVDETYLRFLLDSANRKYATNEARICVFHRMYRAAFTDAALLRSLPHIPGGADAIAADVSETREGDTFADDASLASAQQQSQQQQQAQPQSLVTTAAAAAAMATLLGHTSSSSSSTAPLTSTERVWALAAPLRCSRLVQDAVRARDFRRLELKLVTLPSAAPTHIGTLRNILPIQERVGEREWVYCIWF